MDYNLTRPCDQCPFRTDIPPFIRPARVLEIERTLVQGEFPCHKTTDAEPDEETGLVHPMELEDASHCAGALILMEKMGRSSQMMRIMERTGGYDRDDLDMNAAVYGSFNQMYNAHRAALRQKEPAAKTARSSKPTKKQAKRHGPLCTGKKQAAQKGPGKKGQAEGKARHPRRR